MDPYTIQQLNKAKHDDLVREADEWRLAHESHEDSRPAAPPIPRPRTARRLGFAR
jgi:hypothetical protein